MIDLILKVMALTYAFKNFMVFSDNPTPDNIANLVMAFVFAMNMLGLVVKKLIKLICFLFLLLALIYLIYTKYMNVVI